MPLLDPEIETVRVILPRPQVIRLSDTEIAPGNFGGAFIDLSDVPNSYSGQALKTVRVNAGATGLEFVTSGTGAVDSVFGRTGVVVAVSGDYTAAQVTGAVANTRTINATAPITGGGDLSADRTLAMHVSDTTHDGYLSSTDWNTFNTSASGSYVPTSRTLHIGPTTSDLSANRSFITNVTDDAQTKAAIVPNTAPDAGQALVGNAGGTAYAPETISGSGATISLASTGVVSISGIANASLTNSAITIGGVSTALGGSALGNVTNDTQTKAAVVPNTAPTSGQILVGNAGGTAYSKQTVSGSGATITLNDSGVATISAIANASLSNSSITIAGNSTALGGTVTQDQITGLSSTGLVKRTGSNALSVVVDTTVGDNLVTLANPSAITFIRINADNTVTARSAANFRSDIGAGTGSGDALTSQPLSQFAATTSAQLLGVISDETGSGVLVFSISPTLTGVPLAPTASQGTSNTQIATTAYTDTAVSNAIAGVNPAVAVQAATTAAGDTSGFTYNNGVSGVGATLTGPTANVAVTIDGYTFTAVGQRLLVKNDTQSPSGAFNGVYFLSTLQIPAVKPVFTRALDYNSPSDINNTGAIPVVNGTVNGTTSWVLTSQVTTVGTDPLTFTKFSINPTTIGLTSSPLSQFASTTSLQLLGVMSDETGTGALVFANTPTLVTPVLGAATATSINGNTFTTGTYTLTGVAGKTLTFNKNLTLEGTDATTMTFPTTSATIARTDAANTFTGASTATSWVFTTPVLGTPTSGTLSNCTTATQSAGDNSTKLASTAYADAAGAGHAVYLAASPPTTDVGLFTIKKTGVDLKTNATTDIFTVPAGRTFVCTSLYGVVTASSVPAAVAFVWKVIESGAGASMTPATAIPSTSPTVGRYIAQVSVVSSVYTICAAAAKVQIVISTGFTTSTSVTGDVFLTGFYTT